MRPGHAFGRPVVVLAIGACLLLSGCSRTSQSELEKAKAAGASEQAAKQKQASVEADIQKLKEDLAKAKAQAATPSAAATSAGQTQAPVVPRAQTAQGASCGGNISVGPNTSCAFAFNVASELYDAGGGSRTLSVYSPTTGRYYTMTCVAGVPTVCRGGNNAIVYIR
jgi:Flp pilus assembly protein TadG